MVVLKSVVGGLIGGAIGAVAANVIQSAAGQSSPLFLLITGLGTGIGVRAAAGANRNFVTGLVGVVAAVVALLGSSVATSFLEVGQLGEIGNSATPVNIDEIVDIGELETGDAETGEAVAEDPVGEPAEESAGDDEAAGEDAAGEEAGAGETAAESDAPVPPPVDEQEARAAAAAASEATAPQIEVDPSQAEELAARSGLSPIEFLFNAGSALIAFALSTGTGSTRTESEA